MGFAGAPWKQPLATIIRGLQTTRCTWRSVTLGDVFKELLSFFMNKCKMLKILVISRNDFGTNYEGEQIQPLILPQLGSKQAVQFFLDVLGDEKRLKITTDEIIELILNTPFYPFNKAIPQKGVIINEQITDESREE